MIRNLVNKISGNFSTGVPLREKEYLKLAVKKIHQLTQIAQQLQQKHTIDISASDLILKIHLNNHSIVINTQTPNRQLWYSSTKSGPQRFDYIQTDNQFLWKNNKGNQLSQQLKEDLAQIII